MLTEQITELQLKGFEPPGYMCSETGYFHDKTKISSRLLCQNENLLVDYYFG